MKSLRNVAFGAAAALVVFAASAAEPKAAPTEPPMAPTGVSVTPGSGSVTLNWTAGAGAASYRIHQGTASGFEAKASAKIVVKTTATITGLTAGTEYFFVVQSVNSKGFAYSDEVSVTPK